MKPLILGLGCICLSIGAAPAQGLNVLHPDGVYIQEQTGISYPTSVGDFKRLNIIRYKPDGSDESAGYGRLAPGTEINATVYVFPSPSLTSIGSSQSVIDSARAKLCSAQFANIQKEVTTAHRDAVPLSQDDYTLVQGDNHYVGHEAFYTLMNANFFGRHNIPSRSDVYVFCFAGGKWTVEYRFDYPQVYDASDAIADFMRDLTWTIPPEK